MEEAQLANVISDFEQYYVRLVRVIEIIKNEYRRMICTHNKSIEYEKYCMQLKIIISEIEAKKNKLEALIRALNNIRSIYIRQDANIAAKLSEHGVKKMNQTLGIVNLKKYYDVMSCFIVK